MQIKWLFSRKTRGMVKDAKRELAKAKAREHKAFLVLDSDIHLGRASTTQHFQEWMAARERVEECQTFVEIMKLGPYEGRDT